MSRLPSFDRILLTGGTGFIGRHVLKRLIESGHRPAAVARRIDDVLMLPDVLREHVRWIELDLLDDKSLIDVIQRERPSVLFHLAGSRGVGNGSIDIASNCTAVNVDATLSLLKVATRTGADRIVMTGSAEEYGKQPGPFKESAELHPLSEYGISKAQSTRLALALHDSESCPVVIARLFTVYGPNQSRGMFVSDAVNAAVRGESFSMSDGTQKRDLVFVDDIAAGIVECARAPEIDGKIINFGSGNPVRLRDLAEMIWRISGSDAAMMVGERLRGSDEMDITWADSSLADELLGWRATTDLEAGLTATIDWARSPVSQQSRKGAAIL